jgi:hypothetical protein
MITRPTGLPKSGGRQKGSRNKRNLQVEEMATRFDLDPFEILMMVANGDWQGLGFESPKQDIVTAHGTVSELNIKLSDRLHAAKEAAKYLHAQKQSISGSTSQDNQMVLTIHDYTSNKTLEQTHKPMIYPVPRPQRQEF